MLDFIRRYLIVIPILLFICVILLNLFIWNSPKNFPMYSTYIIEEGVSLNSLANHLVKKNIIKSPFWFKVFVVLNGGRHGVKFGEYALDTKPSVITLAKRMTAGDYGVVALKITIPEGFNVYELARIFSKKFKFIDEKNFIELASANEGYLFPDTYLFLPGVTTTEVLNKLKTNFDIKMITIGTELASSTRSFADIIKMASILEDEARTTESRKIISDILWRRIDIGMPLQVDASFKYINGKGTSELTLADLKIKSPYNSYLYTGLPPTPINNPGLDSIIAAANPTKTSYLYFLSDSEGNMHYAKTYSGHLQNKELYLR